MKLFNFQKELINSTSDINRVGYFCEMGTGKTFIGSEKIMSFSENKSLIVCQCSKVKDWVEHFKNNYNVEVFNLKQNVDDFIRYADKCVGVINYETLIRRPVFKKLNNFNLMLDESSLIQNDKSKRSKFILSLNPINVVLLSGTPCNGKYELLYSQLKLLGLKMSKSDYYDSFVNYHLESRYSPKPYLCVDGYKNVDSLKNLMYNLGCRFLKASDVLDLPEQTFTDINVKPDSYYKQFMKHNYINVNGTEYVGDTVLKKLLYGRMLCNNNEKQTVLKDLLDSNDERVIVFYNFNSELETLKNIIKRPLSIINGNEKDLNNYENCYNSVTLVQYQSGAYGLNLQKARLMIFYSLPLSSEQFEQAKKRIHRVGQNNNCSYYSIVCEGVETKLYSHLKMLQDYTAELFKVDFKNV